jgi:hypothetical protein
MTSRRPHYFLPEWIVPSERTIDADVCVYGGTAAGVIAAVAASRRGKRVTLLQPGTHLGGMTTGGLGETDFGAQHVIGGMARQFYRDLGRYYGRDEEWKFEPSAAAVVLNGYLRETDVIVHLRQYLRQVEIDGVRITAVEMLGGLRVRAKMFIDATYEGDLLAQAGVSYTIGREGNHHYGETIAGVQVREHHQFTEPVDPYVIPGDPTSGTLPLVNARAAAPMGTGDGRVQAYNFRICMTDDPSSMVHWERPEDFDPQRYELARRWFNAHKDAYNEQLGLQPAHLIRKFDVLTQRTKAGHFKTDTNNHGAVSSDFVGANYAWPEADYAQRELIFQAHVTYQKGLYWFLANDPSVPARYRDAYARWGLAGDEFVDTGHWPHQLYVREARRMVSDYVLTEHDTQHHRQPADPVGMGSYNMDSHNCQRFVAVINGVAQVRNEGDVQLPPKAPYGISYRSIIPRRGECANLLVPVCVSASHIAYGSVRMEPVFMVLGESSAVAASLAIDMRCDTQSLPFEELSRALAEAGQVILGPVEISGVSC